MKFCIVTPWHNEKQKEKFLEGWNINKVPDWLIFQEDKDKSGCGKTKNAGIEEALRRDAEVVIVLDDDCYPDYSWPECADRMGERYIDWFAKEHLNALTPHPVCLYEAITDPPSRGTPYFNRTVIMPVAASMGFWAENPDYDAPHQLVGNNNERFLHPMLYKKTMFWRFFPFSGMNCAFRSEFWPHFKFDETADRFDDIFMGYRLQAEAYRRGYCINLNGPSVRHSRQSNVWKNLRVESENMERNEHEWKQYVKP